MQHKTNNTEEGGWRFDNTYARLPTLFYRRTDPEPVKAPALTIFNHALAQELGLDGRVLDTPDGALIFAGNSVPPGATPIAQAYAGHQFGHFTMLGDGRALVLGEQITPDGQRVDIQWKGSGQTPFSRRGDGRAALGPMLREYLISEAMFALGIPTTRSLAVASTGEPVFRETPLKGGVLTRVAASHIRVGTFQYAMADGGPEVVRTLADYTIQRHFPECAEAEQPYLAFFNAVADRQASLIARWMNVGFVHGVMNTDNMALSGETIDYGPCAFMDTYHPATVFSSIDRHGRYAYGNQPNIAQWNLARLAETLLPLLDADEQKAIEQAEEALHQFSVRFKGYWMDGLRAKLGLFEAAEDDASLIDPLLQWMQDSGADYTNTFRELSSDAPPHADLSDWHQQWRARLAQQAKPINEAISRMRAHNPSIIPRNHLVEAALTAAAESDDLQSFQSLLTALATPYDYDHPDHAALMAPPHKGAERYVTYCGT